MIQVFAGGKLKTLIAASCFYFAMSAAAQGAVLVTNFIGGPYQAGTTLGNGLFIEGSRNFQAFGVTIGGTAVDFVSLETIFDNNALIFERVVSGGIYSDNGGNPGIQLAAFIDVTLPPSVQDVLLISDGSLTLQANTTYWFVLTGPVGAGLLPNWQQDTNNTAPVGFGLATPVGYRFSGNNQASWSVSGVNNQLLINIADDFPIDVDVPEPSTFVLSAAGLLLVGGLMRRR
jgi:hypothetical protein